MRKARVELEPELLPRPSVDASIPSFSPMRESFDTSAPVGPLTEKQRLLNVRRAKKMTRVSSLLLKFHSLHNEFISSFTIALR